MPATSGGSKGRGKGKASNPALHDDEDWFRSWVNRRRKELRDKKAVKGMTYPKSHMHPRRP
jgi:hypothetical protein